MKLRFRWRTPKVFLLCLLTFYLPEVVSGSLTLQGGRSEGRNIQPIEIYGPNVNSIGDNSQVGGGVGPQIDIPGNEGLEVNPSNRRKKRELTAPESTNASLHSVKNYTVSN